MNLGNQVNVKEIILSKVWVIDISCLVYLLVPVMQFVIYKRTGLLIFKTPLRFSGNDGGFFSGDGIDVAPSHLA